MSCQVHVLSLAIFLQVQLEHMSTLYAQAPGLVWLVVCRLIGRWADRLRSRWQRRWAFADRGGKFTKCCNLPDICQALRSAAQVQPLPSQSLSPDSPGWAVLAHSSDEPAVPPLRWQCPCSHLRLLCKGILTSKAMHPCLMYCFYLLI